MTKHTKMTPFVVDADGRLVPNEALAIDVDGKNAGQIASAIERMAKEREPASACPTAETFTATLPEGWSVEIMQFGRGYLVTASNTIYGRASIGPKLRLVPSDVQALRAAVDDVEAPPLTYSQWLQAGRRHGYLTLADDEPLPRMLRLLAVCIERDDVEASDVAQALLRRLAGPATAAASYTLECPVAEASNSGRNVAELYALLMRVAEQYDISLRTQDKPMFPDDADFERASGDVTCSVCGLLYYQHPNAENFPTMHRICEGAWTRAGKPDVVWVKT